MRKELQIFTSLQRQRAPVPNQVLDTLEDEAVIESLLREAVRACLRLIAKKSRVF